MRVGVEYFQPLQKMLLAPVSKPVYTRGFSLRLRLIYFKKLEAFSVFSFSTLQYQAYLLLLGKCWGWGLFISQSENESESEF